MTEFSSFAIIPAAGRSRRMGTSKLLLEVAGRPLIEHLLQAWVDSAADKVVVVVRKNDAMLIKQCREFQVHVVPTGANPPEMRDSLEIGLQFVADSFAPRSNDAWLVAPADMPGLKPRAIDSVLSQYNPSSPRVLVPQVEGKHGHPALLPWSEAVGFRASPLDEGLNTYVRRSRPLEVRLDDRGMVDDVDTPADYRRVSAQWEN
jgi:molybdenum cofactor cytidylyltransferase